MEDKSSVLLQTRGFGKILLLGKALSHFVAYHLHTLLLTIAFKIIFFEQNLGTSNAIWAQATKGKSGGPKESHFGVGRSSEDAEKGGTSRAL